MNLLQRLASFRLRLLFRGAFLVLLAIGAATLYYVLREEKQLSYDDYQYGFQKNIAQITTRLRHPTGQLALLNPPHPHGDDNAVHPVLLPYAAIDFDDQAKVRQAIEMTGCLAQYVNDGALCVAIGNSAWAGGFIYIAGFFNSGNLTPHTPGVKEFDGADRVHVSVAIRGETERFIAPFELVKAGPASHTGQRGALTGFTEDERGEHGGRPDRDFRGWIWQSDACLDGSRADGCLRRAFFSLRVPVEVLRLELYQNQHVVWPPADFDQIAVSVKALAADTGASLFDSSSPRLVSPFELTDLTPLLLPGETLTITKIATPRVAPLLELHGEEVPRDLVWTPIGRLIEKLPVKGYDRPLEASETISTPSGGYLVALHGNVRSANAQLSSVAARVSWFVGAMLAAILLAWAVIEAGMMSRITMLKQRAESLTSTMRELGDIDRFDVTDLKGRDELGILATCLSNLLKRIKEDAQREKIRADHEKDMWQAVGHEIMSPLQSLLALHGKDSDASRRYILRMQQAVKVLYGTATPSEAFESTRLQLVSIDLNAFLANVADNASFIGITQVVYTQNTEAVLVRADEYSLEDVISHVLRNADRHRLPGSPISIRLAIDGSYAEIVIHNQGAPIPETLIDRIFEYGVSDQGDSAAQGNRGQGLFVAKTYMAKMAGTIVVRNTTDGVEFALRLPLSEFAAHPGDHVRMLN
jgi:signal transduction histidine kinase